MIWTLSDIKDKVRRDLNLFSERFVRPEELTSYINSAIEYGEQIINMQGSDYYLSKKEYVTVDGDTFLAMPADVFNGWIRYIEFVENVSDSVGIKYKVKKITFDEISNVSSTDSYRYLFTNDSVDGPRINIYPAIRESGTGHFKAYYVRKAKRLVNDIDVCDFPRMEYIFSYTKLQCLPKDLNERMMEFEFSRFSKEEERLIQIFQTLSADGEDNKIEPTNAELEDFYNHM